MNIDLYLNKHLSQSNLHFLVPPAKSLDGSVDEYEKNLLTTIKINLKELKLKSEEAYECLSLLALLHKDDIPLSYIEDWLCLRNSRSSALELIKLINQYSFVDLNTLKSKKGHLSMHELIKKIVNSFLPNQANLIDEAAVILTRAFGERSDEAIEAILKDPTPLTHAVALSNQADLLNHHSQSLTELRIIINNILIGDVRDLTTAKVISDHLEKDWQVNIRPSPADELTYNTDVLLFYAILTDYEKAKGYGEKALKLVEQGIVEEKLRFYADWIQYNSLVGVLDGCQSFIEKGKALLPLSKSQAINKLYLLSVTIYHLNRGEYANAIALSQQYPEIATAQLRRNPTMQFYFMLSLIEALIKQGEICQGKTALTELKAKLKEYYANEDNSLFAAVGVLTVMAELADHKCPSTAEISLKKAFKTYEKVYQGPDKHRNQAIAHLVFGKLYHCKKNYAAAKEQYLKSEEVFVKILQNQKIDGVSDLYKHLAILGADSKDESITHIYLAKHIEFFGLDHQRTKEIIHYLNEKRLPLPL